MQIPVLASNWKLEIFSSPSRHLIQQSYNTIKLYEIIELAVGEEVVGSIGPGICVLLGISRDDNHKDTEFMVRKLLNLRLFDDESGKRWCKSVKDLNLEILCVSQFTLQAVLKGNKPDFHNAMMAEFSETFFKDFIVKLSQSYDPPKIQQGKFSAYMQVHIQNDGPVTIEVNSPPPRMSKQQFEGKSKTEKSADASSNLADE